MNHSHFLKHIAIVMDGNARWAKARGLPLIAGHRAGIKALEQAVKRGAELGIKYMTFFAFSSENWNREQEWVSEFMGLLRWYLEHSINNLIENGVSIKIIGDKNHFSKDIQFMLNNIEERTKNNQTITAIIALSYGGKDDIRRAVSKIAKKVKENKINPQEITEDLISDHLDTKDCPDPDLFIRTSGETRLSNFLLWQMAYTEMIFTDCFWPDFSAKNLDYAIEQYYKRNRRFGVFNNVFAA